VPALLAGTLASSVLYWWYSRRIVLSAVTLQRGETVREATQLLKLGLALLASGLMTMGAGYAVRTFVLRDIGLEAAGIYQAAWTLGGLYVGFVLGALGTDFYPRLVGLANDHRACNAAVNEQAQASLLLAAPGIVGTISFAPWVIHLFYSAAFADAVELLRWMCMGMALRVVTWPVIYIIIAKNRQLVYFGVEASWAVFNVATTWWCMRSMGLLGTGVAFVLSYVFNVLVVYPTARAMTGFRWSPQTLRDGSLFVVALAAAFIGSDKLPTWPALAFGTCLTLASLVYSLRTLMRLSGMENSPAVVRRLLRLGKPA